MRREIPEFRTPPVCVLCICVYCMCRACIMRDHCLLATYFLLCLRFGNIIDACAALMRTPAPYFACVHIIDTCGYSDPAGPRSGADSHVERMALLTLSYDPSCPGTFAQSEVQHGSMLDCERGMQGWGMGR